jgi:hypothetical protein
MPRPSPNPADGAPDRRPYVNQGVYCYHEAGHAVAFWHYGIELEYVTMRPPPGSGHGGQTKTVDRTSISGINNLENEMRCAAAGSIAQTRVFRLKQVPSEEALMREFRRNAEWVRAHPETPAFDDGTIFARTALARDEAMSTANPEAPVGPATWVTVWREAEDLIRVRLWPAVQAVAEELRRREQSLTNADVAEIATTAMRYSKTT